MPSGTFTLEHSHTGQRVGKFWSRKVAKRARLRMVRKHTAAALKRSSK